MDELRRILEMLAAGQISVDEALELVSALEGERQKPRRGRFVRIDIQGPDDKVKVHIPLALARFAARFLPKEARSALGAADVSLDELLAELTPEAEGKLLEVDVDEDGEKTRILIEVV